MTDRRVLACSRSSLMTFNDPSYKDKKGDYRPSEPFGIVNTKL